MSEVKSLAGAVPPIQLPFVPHAVVVAVALQSIVAAWAERGITRTMDASRIKVRAHKSRPWPA